MSALPLKADVCSANTDVRHGPEADIQEFSCSEQEKPPAVSRQGL
jgi:hypothetical protein